QLKLAAGTSRLVAGACLGHIRCAPTSQPENNRETADAARARRRGDRVSNAASGLSAPASCASAREPECRQFSDSLNRDGCGWGSKTLSGHPVTAAGDHHPPSLGTCTVDD